MRLFGPLIHFGFILALACVVYGNIGHQQNQDSGDVEVRNDTSSAVVTSSTYPLVARRSRLRKKRFVRGLLKLGRVLFVGARLGGRISGAVLRVGRPLYTLVAFVCSGVQMSLSIAEATMECPAWKRDVCRLGAEIKVENENYRAKTGEFLAKRKEFFEGVMATSKAYTVNEELNITFAAIYRTTQMIHNLTMLNPDLEFLPRSSEDPKSFTNVHFDESDFEEMVNVLGKRIRGGWNSENKMGTIFGGLGFVYGTGALIYQASKFRQARIDRTNVRAQDLVRKGQVFRNGIRSLIPRVDGKFVVDEYGGHWHVDNEGKAHKRLSKSEIHQLNNGIIVDRSKIVSIGGKAITPDRRYFKAAKVVSKIGKFIGRFTFPALDILGSAYCIYSIDAMIRTQVQKFEKTLNEEKQKIIDARNNVVGNTTAMEQESVYLKGNFTENVAAVTILFSGLITDAIERGVDNSNPAAIEKSTTREYQYLSNLNNTVIDYTNIEQVQGTVRHLLSEFEELVKMNLFLTQLSIKVHNYVKNLIPPSSILRALKSELPEMNDLQLYEVLLVIIVEKRGVDYYFNWPLCKIRNKSVRNQQQLEALDVYEPSKELRSFIRSSLRFQASPSDTTNYWNQDRPNKRINEEFVWRILAREILPKSTVTYKGRDLNQYRSCA